MRERVDLELLMPTIEEVISHGGIFRLYPRGTSMLPLLVEGKDSVELCTPHPFKVGDALLYRRENGQFVLHRLVGTCRRGLIFCGDHQIILEYGIPASAVLARMCGYYKEDVHHTLDEPDYVRYAAERVTRFPWLYRKSYIAYRIGGYLFPLRTLPGRAWNKLLRMLKIKKSK